MTQLSLDSLSRYKFGNDMVGFNLIAFANDGSPLQLRGLYSREFTEKQILEFLMQEDMKSELEACVSRNMLGKYMGWAITRNDAETAKAFHRLMTQKGYTPISSQEFESRLNVLPPAVMGPCGFVSAEGAVEFGMNYVNKCGGHFKKEVPLNDRKQWLV